MKLLNQLDKALNVGPEVSTKVTEEDLQFFVEFIERGVQSGQIESFELALTYNPERQKSAYSKWRDTEGYYVINAELNSYEAVAIKSAYFELAQTLTKHVIHTRFKPAQIVRSIAQNCNGLGGNDHTLEEVYQVVIAYRSFVE